MIGIEKACDECEKMYKVIYLKKYINDIICPVCFKNRIIKANARIDKNKVKDLKC